MSLCVLSGDANIQGFIAVILNTRKLVFHISHTVFLFHLGSTLPEQTLYWGLPSDVEIVLLGCSSHRGFSVCCLMILVNATSESLHSYDLGSSKDHRANPYFDDHPGNPPSRIPNAHLS